MSKNLQNIDKLFRDAIEGHEDMPDEKLWDSIDAGLDKSNVVNINRKYNNLKRVAAALLVLLLSVVGYEVFKTKKGTVETASNNKNNSTQKTASDVGAQKTGAANSSNTAAGYKTNEGSITQSNNIATASYDSANNTTVSNEGKVTTATNKPGQLTPAETNTVADITFNKKNTKKNILSSDNKNTDEYANSKPLKKSGKGKTNVKIKSPVPQQYSNESSDNYDAINNDAVADISLNTKQLLPASSLGKRISQSMAVVSSSAINRNTPDAVFKKQRSSKSVRLNLMPFFSPQLIASNIKETLQAPGPGNSPGGPPPPRPGGGGDHKAQYKKDEQEQTAYSLGVLAELPLGKKWSIQSGISYLSKTISIEPKKIYARPDKDGKVKYVFDCSSGYSYISSKTGSTPLAGDSITTRSSKNVLGYISVPVAVNYKFSLGKFNIIPSIGSVFNFLTKQKTETELVQGNAKEKQTINKLQGLSRGYISATAGIAFEYNISKRLAVNLMPSGNFAVTSVNNSSAPVKSFPDAFAVAAGLKIKL